MLLFLYAIFSFILAIMISISLYLNEIKYCDTPVKGIVIIFGCLVFLWPLFFFITCLDLIYKRFS